MLLDTLLARVTGMPGFEFYKELGPRRFLIDHLLVEVIKATEVLPADKATGLFAVITTSPLGLPETLPPNWIEVDRLGDYFATYHTPTGTTAQQVTESLALELIPFLYSSEVYEKRLFAWLKKELGTESGEGERAPEEDRTFPGAAPGPPFRIIDIPHPSTYRRRMRSEEEEDHRFLFGDETTPPSCHRFERDSVPQMDDMYGPPEFYEQDIEDTNENTFF